MARILICEPHPDIRSLLVFVVRRLGHEPVLADGSETQAADVDAIVLEPGSTEARRVAAWARLHAPEVALVCTSHFPRGPEADALAPDAYLVKPFPLVRLEAAIRAALRGRAVASA